MPLAERRTLGLAVPLYRGLVDPREWDERVPDTTSVPSWSTALATVWVGPQGPCLMLPLICLGS